MIPASFLTWAHKLSTNRDQINVFSEIIPEHVIHHAWSMMRLQFQREMCVSPSAGTHFIRVFSFPRWHVHPKTTLFLDVAVVRVSRWTLSRGQVIYRPPCTRGIASVAQLRLLRPFMLLAASQEEGKEEDPGIEGWGRV